jgi:hypothetical protein
MEKEHSGLSRNPPFDIPAVTSTDISIPPGFTGQIRYHPVCIPTPVAGIMLKSYPQLPKGIGEWVNEKRGPGDVRTERFPSPSQNG